MKVIIQLIQRKAIDILNQNFAVKSVIMFLE